MTCPHGVDTADDAVRQLAGRCYIALRTSNAGVLSPAPTSEILVRSELAGLYANLCAKLGVKASPHHIVAGMQLSVVNLRRWQSLRGLLASLKAEGIEPVLFKGGVLHARWPELRDLRAMADYDLIVPQAQVGRLRSILAAQGFETLPAASRLTQRLCKGWMVWKGSGVDHQNLDIHARVTEPPVCDSLTRSILATRQRAEGIRVPDVEDCVCMIALHIVRSGMARPLREYIDLLWYVDGLDEDAWQRIRGRAQEHALLPALFLSLRQAVYCLDLERLDPPRAAALTARVLALQAELGALRLRALDWLAPPDYPLHPIESRNRPLFRRSLILGTGTSSTWRVAAAFLLYGAARAVDGAWPTTSEGEAET